MTIPIPPISPTPAPKIGVGLAYALLLLGCAGLLSMIIYNAVHTWSTVYHGTETVVAPLSPAAPAPITQSPPISIPADLPLSASTAAPSVKPSEFFGGNIPAKK